MANLKTNRTFKTASNNTQPMTDELYAELSLGQQFIAATAEALEVPVQVAEYEGRYFIHRETIEAAAEVLFEPAKAEVKA